MSFEIVILPSAKSDIESAINWYESRNAGLGKRFLQQVIKAIDSLLDPRKGYGVVYMSLSRVFVKDFPYVIYFKTDSTKNRIVIYAILSEKQNREDVLEKRV